MHALSLLSLVENYWYQCQECQHTRGVRQKVGLVATSTLFSLKPIVSDVGSGESSELFLFPAADDAYSIYPQVRAQTNRFSFPWCAVPARDTRPCSPSPSRRDAETFIYTVSLKMPDAPHNPQIDTSMVANDSNSMSKDITIADDSNGLAS